MCVGGGGGGGSGWMRVCNNLVSRASPPCRTAGTIFLCTCTCIHVYVSDDLAPCVNCIAYGPVRLGDCLRTTRKRNQPCLFCSPSMCSSQLEVYFILCIIHFFQMCSLNSCSSV